MYKVRSDSEGSLIQKQEIKISGDVEMLSQLQVFQFLISKGFA